VCTDETYEEMREAGAVSEDPVEWAKEILLVERLKELLLALGAEPSSPGPVAVDRP